MKNNTSADIQYGIDSMNAMGAARQPFVFIIDYALQQPLFLPIDAIDRSLICFDVNGVTNADGLEVNIPDEISFSKHPVPISEYTPAFSQVMAELVYGNSFLLNLTFSTRIETNLTMQQVFFLSRAKYRLYVKDKFVVFSPETFVRIQDGRISAYPMKGTIDASLPDAERQIMENSKETAEHITIVDLLRNDLSQVARDVRVDKFRYLDRIHTNQKTLLQVSSEISGSLPDNYHEKLGDIIYALLPAGSISGAPKRKTVEILNNAESHVRGYFTGIFGFFDGENLDSGVMIRFIEQQGEKLIYKSGGGITAQSILEEEYQEMLDKVYLPLK